MENLEQRTWEIIEKLIGKKLAEKRKRQKFSGLDNLTIPVVITAKMMTPIYGDNLMIDCMRLSNEAQPMGRNFNLALLGTCLIGKYSALGALVYTLSQFYS